MLFNPVDLSPNPVKRSEFSAIETGNTGRTLPMNQDCLGFVVHNPTNHDLYVLLDTRQETDGSFTVDIDTNENFSFVIKPGGTYTSQSPLYTGIVRVIFKDTDVTGTNTEKINISRFY